MIGRGQKKATDNELIAAYAELGSVWKVAEQLGMCGQSVHERLTRLGAVNTRKDEFTFQQQKLISDVYSQGFDRGDGVLNDLVKILGKSKQNVCRWAKRNGLTNASRNVDPDLAAERGRQVRAAFKKNGHPRGSLGMKHSPASRKKISTASLKSAAARTVEQRAAMALKSLKTREQNGTLYSERQKTTWKAGWREIGGVRKYYRSRWEANYARYLEFLRIHGEIQAWEHEPETFWFEKIMRGVRSYLPDFRVTRQDGTIYYVEVKGWMDDRSKTKVRRMKKYHPQIELIVVEGPAYRALVKSVAGVIKGWE